VITLVLLQLIIFYLIFFIVNKIEVSAPKLSILDYFLGALAPLIFLTILANLNSLFFPVIRKFASPGTLIWNFLASTPLGVGYYVLRRFFLHDLRAGSTRVVGLVFLFLLQALLYSLLPDFGY